MLCRPLWPADDDYNVSDDKSRWRQGLPSATMASATITARFVLSPFNPGERFLNVVVLLGRAKEGYLDAEDCAGEPRPKVPEQA